jgi:hypothetical protein
MPFDFKKIFLEYFLGSIELFIFAFVILISFVCAKMGISGKLYLVILGLSAIIFASYLGNAIYVLVILVIGLISFKSIARLLAG